MLKIMSWAIVILFILLVLQFNSFIWPLTVMLVIPAGIAGSLLALWLTGSTLNIMSGIGVIAMLGISVNDAILKVSAIRQNGSKPLSDAIHSALVIRLKPILMTTGTTLIACAPMLLMPGYGNELQRPMAIALIGGIVFSTIAALIFIPAAASILNHYGVLMRQPTGRTSA